MGGLREDSCDLGKTTHKELCQIRNRDPRSANDRIYRAHGQLMTKTIKLKTE